MSSSTFSIRRFVLLWTLLSASLLYAGSFRTVVIDPGHGGRDNGGNVGKVYEKHLALDTALRLERYLKRKGFRTYMTRRSDRFITLARRAQIGNSFRNSIFVSIHYNYTYKRHVSGLETFYCGSQGRPLATLIQQGMLAKVRAVDRGVKYARYAVLRRSTLPAALVECGFISNASERRRMKTGRYRQRIAEGIGNGIIAYQRGRRSGRY